MKKFSRPYGLLFLSFSLLIMISGAAAQDSNSTPEEESKNVLVELDNATWISDISWYPENSSMIQVSINSEIPKQVAIQEIPDYSGRSGSFSPMKQMTLQPGKNTVLVPVNGRRNLGIAITDSNDGAYYQKDPAGIPDPGPIDAIFISFYGSLFTVLTFLGLRGLSKFKLKAGYIKD